MGRPKNEAGRAEILRAAYAMLMERGYGATTYREIAQATGKRPATVQSLFPEKSIFAVSLIRRLVDGCSAFAAARGLITGDVLGDLDVIGQLYFGFLLSGAKMRRLTGEILADRSLTSASLLFNEEWVSEYFGLDDAQSARCAQAFVFAMGGGYEVAYQSLVGNEPVDIAELVGVIIDSFVANAGIASLVAPQRSTVSLDAAALNEAIPYLREYIIA